MDCRLIDLQMIRFGSPVLDFSYIFYTSLTAETRRREHSAFLSCYHSNYSRIMRAGGLSVQFSVDELDQEYRDKSFYGLLLGATAIPLFMAAGGMGMEDFVVNEGDISQYEIKFMKLLQTYAFCYVASRYKIYFLKTSSIRSIRRGFNNSLV